MMLREEPMTAQDQITDADLMRRILYTSRDVRWHAGIVPVSGTLYTPKGTPPSGGWPVVAWAHGTLGVADSCAPSWTTHIPRDAAYINQWLKQGFAVVATDYQGWVGRALIPISSGKRKDVRCLMQCAQPYAYPDYSLIT
jgi:dipeptidyl aminopeptidase/acylaminoacyl peptidase